LSDYVQIWVVKAVKGDSRLASSVANKSNVMSIRLARTKTGKNKSVKVLHPAVFRLMSYVLVHTNKNERLFPFAASTLRNYFRTTRDTIGLDPKIVFHSLRHGGATHLFEDG